MRKVILAICLMVAMQTVNAQTEAETLEWLNVKKVDIERFDYSMYSSEKLRAAGPYEDLPSDIKWEDIKEIIFSANKESIVVKGKVLYRCLRSECDWDNKEVESLTIYCKSSAPSETIERFVKALKHMAELKGAKFLKDDLF